MMSRIGGKIFYLNFSSGYPFTYLFMHRMECTEICGKAQGVVHLEGEFTKHSGKHRIG